MADPIPQLDLKAQYEALQRELGAAMQKVLSEQKFVQARRTPSLAPRAPTRWCSP